MSYLSHTIKNASSLCCTVSRTMRASCRTVNLGQIARTNPTKLTRHTITGASSLRAFSGSALRCSSPPTEGPRFADLANIDPILLETLTKDMSFDHMMPVQAATLHELLENRVDCLAQAKTGTGKTIAFLLPAIQTLINKQRTPGESISLLVISPTRELAMQIEKEAKTLLKKLPKYKTIITIGGTNKSMEEKRLLEGADVLIATPGRLLDHMMNPDIVKKFQSLDTLVLDEADRLLDMGFRKDLEKIVARLPNKKETKRQGMLFSATIAPYVQDVANLVLADDYKFISTISEGEASIHEHVPQSLVSIPDFSDVAPALVGHLKEEMKKTDPKSFKAIVFLPTAALASYYELLLTKMQIPDFPEIFVLHSRLTQGRRTRVTNDFRGAKSGILVATDVVARGMDFPAVTNVIQVGIPEDKEAYVHRLGRTARAGAEGKGTIILTNHEDFFIKKHLTDVKLVPVPADLSSKADVVTEGAKLGAPFFRKVYQAWLGYYKNHLKSLKWNEERLVEEGNKFIKEGLGAATSPGLPKKTVGKMGLRGVKGLLVTENPPELENEKATRERYTFES